MTVQKRSKLCNVQILHLCLSVLIIISVATSPAVGNLDFFFYEDRRQFFSKITFALSAWESTRLSPALLNRNVPKAVGTFEHRAPFEELH